MSDEPQGRSEGFVGLSVGVAEGEEVGLTVVGLSVGLEV